MLQILVVARGGEAYHQCLHHHHRAVDDDAEIDRTE